MQNALGVWRGDTPWEAKHSFQLSTFNEYCMQFEFDSKYIIEKSCHCYTFFEINDKWRHLILFREHPYKWENLPFMMRYNIKFVYRRCSSHRSKKMGRKDDFCTILISFFFIYVCCIIIILFALFYCIAIPRLLTINTSHCTWVLSEGSSFAFYGKVRICQA